MTSKPHIIWDWNGTLVGDGRALIESVIAAFAITGLGSVTTLDHQRHFTRPISSFFDKLAGRSLSQDEYRELREKFDQAYDEKRAQIKLTPGAYEVLDAWSRSSHTQSVLSMCPEAALVAHVREYRIADFFTRIDGFPGTGPDTKAYHLERHLVSLTAETRDHAVLIGDTTDDLMAAQQAGIPCVVYHHGADSLQAIEHFDHLGAEVVPTLSDAIARVAEIC